MLPLSTQSMGSPAFSPSPTTTTILPSGPVAAMQSPLPLSFAQVISVAIAKVETRHITAMAPPRVLPTLRNIGVSFLLDDMRGGLFCYSPCAPMAFSCLSSGRTPGLPRDEGKIYASSHYCYNTDGRAPSRRMTHI